MSSELYKRIAPQARAVAETLEPDEDDFGTAYLDPLRKLARRTEERLEAEGFKEERVGVECTDIRTWKDRLDGVRDRHLFLYLLRDSVETHLVFYREHAGFDADDEAAFIAYVEEGNSLASQETIVRAWQWLQEVDAPTELEHRQQTLDTVMMQGGA